MCGQISELVGCGDAMAPDVVIVGEVLIGVGSHHDGNLAYGHRAEQMSNAWDGPRAL